MSGQVKVCFISTHHDDTDARIVHKEAVSLSNAGYDVTYITPFGNSREEKGVTIHIPDFAQENTFNTLPGGLIRIIFGLLLFFEAIKNGKYEVYHFHDPELLPIGFFIQFFIEGKFVYDAHEDARRAIKHKQWVPRRLSPAFSLMLAFNDRIFANYMDGIITASDDISDRYTHHDNVITVTNYPPKKWAELDYSPTNSNSIQITYCGLLSEKRGILQIIKAVKHIPEDYDVVLKLGGRYESEKFQQKVENVAGSSSRIKLLGWLPTHQDVIELYYDSDIGLMCFQSEAKNLTYGAYRSNKLFLYMAAGIPIIVSDIGNWPSVVKGNNCGLSVEPEPKNISSAIVDLIDNPEQRKNLGKNGKKAVVEKYTWEEQEKKLIGFYDNLVG